MKITQIQKSNSASAKSHVRVTFSEKSDVRFIEGADGTSTLSIGAGTFAKINLRSFRILSRTIIRTARSHKIEKLTIDLDEPIFANLTKWAEMDRLVATLAENMLLADYEFTTYKTTAPYELKEVVLRGALAASGKKALAEGITVGEYTNLCRNIANTPGGVMTPELLATRAKEAAKGTRATVTVFDKKRIEKEKMGALLGVANGSKYGPRFIIMEYYGAEKATKKQSGVDKHKHNPVVFVGKGITFDTGGLNIKPGDGMLDMHLDMSGGAAVIAAVACVAKLGLKRNVIGLIPAAENAISDVSMRPGDILTTLSGKTVDVLNTDAEGRLVLADALTYAKRYTPSLVIDVATLTGASLIALGTHASALMTKDDTLRERLMALAEDSGDYLWPLPLWDEYRQYTNGRFADVANIPASGSSRFGGAINGGMFLSRFTEDYPADSKWAHIDMAPRMTSVPSDKLGKGATGEPVRLLVKIAQEYGSTK